MGDALESFYKFLMTSSSQARGKLIVVPAHYVWMTDQCDEFVEHRTRYFVPEAAYRDGTCGTKCVLWCSSIPAPRPKDYYYYHYSAGVAYVLPPEADPVDKVPVVRSAPDYGCVQYCGCASAVPDCADRTKMYPQCYPSHQVMVSPPRGEQTAKH